MFIPFFLLSGLVLSTYADNQGDGSSDNDRDSGGASWEGAISSAGDCYNAGFNGESD